MDLDRVIAAVSGAFTRDNLLKYQFECLALGFIVLYALFYWAGSSALKVLVRKWNNYLWRPQGVLARNFAVHPGTPEGQKHAWREALTVYRSFATGRRYCEYALVTLDLAAQQDAIMHIWHLFKPRRDLLHVDVLFNEGLMPPTVLMVAASRALGNKLLKQQPGISSFAKPVQPSKERSSNWPSQCVKEWSIMAEQPAVLYDLLNADPAIIKALSSPYFRSVLISSEDLRGSDDSSESSSSAGGGEGSNGDSSSGSSSSKGARQQLRAVFQLPPEHKQEDIDALLAAVFMLVDLVATYKMPPEMRERAKALRLKLEQEAARKISQSRQGHLAQKRSERLEAERARARAAGPAALAKFDERLQRQMQKREVRKRTMKM